MEKKLLSKLKSLLNLYRPEKYSKKDCSVNDQRYISNIKDITIQEYDPYIEGLTKQLNNPEQSGNDNQLRSYNNAMSINTAGSL